MSSSIETQQAFSNFTRYYITQQLRKYGYKRAAGSISANMQPPSDLSYKLMQKISNQLAEEKKEQLDEVCFDLQLNRSNLQDTFEALSGELFHDRIIWGRIVTFIAFTGALAVYCAENNLEDQVQCITEWAGSFIQTNLATWMANNGGWPAFVKHFTDQEINTFIPTFLIGMGLTALTITGGLFALKRKSLL
jgi:hypothetical protein